MTSIPDIDKMISLRDAYSNVKSLISYQTLYRWVVVDNRCEYARFGMRIYIHRDAIKTILDSFKMGGL